MQASSVPMRQRLYAGRPCFPGRSSPFGELRQARLPLTELSPVGPAHAKQAADCMTVIPASLAEHWASPSPWPVVYTPPPARIQQPGRLRQTGLLCAARDSQACRMTGWAGVAVTFSTPEPPAGTSPHSCMLPGCRLSTPLAKGGSLHTQAELL